MTRANLKKYKTLFNYYYHSIKVNTKSPRICINWNPPFQTQIYLDFNSIHKMLFFELQKKNFHVWFFFLVSVNDNNFLFFFQVFVLTITPSHIGIIHTLWQITQKLKEPNWKPDDTPKHEKIITEDLLNFNKNVLR